MTNIDTVKKDFKNPSLFEQALTHRSWVNEHKNVRMSNERLEFLGDAVLELVVSKILYDKYPDKEEGYLTALRANIVNTQALFEVAGKLGIGKLLYLSKGEDDGGGRESRSLLADTVEAIIGAIFIDAGLSKASEFIEENILENIEDKAQKPLKDPKSRLQEYTQSKGLPAPIYKVVDESGPDHSKKFVVEVSVNGEVLGQGQGKSKSFAEQAAARQSLASNVK